MSPSQQNSTFGPIAVTIYEARDAGVDLARLQEPTARIDPSVHHRIVGKAVELSGDWCFGLRLLWQGQ